MCERFHCLPWQLAREDLGALLRGVSLLDTYRLGQKVKAQQKLTPEENAEVGKLLMSEAPQ